MQILSAVTCLAAISVASHHDLPAIKEAEHVVRTTTQYSTVATDVDTTEVEVTQTVDEETTELEVMPQADYKLKGFASKQVESMWDSIGNLWDDATSIYDAGKCSQYDTAKECQTNKCDLCRGGTILQQLYQMGKIPTIISSTMSEAQLKSGDLCGVGETYCGTFTSYFEKLPSALTTALSWLHITIPEFCPKGVCKTSGSSGVGESVAASFVGAAALVYAAL